ncbi:ubiquitin carboxyl-terminal hydrolase isozyme L3-like [Macrotis lagotis]|uniref:ubiquitin carboxyl-terminal hydrolase isozyme L3-like n=1 Tax=Macrotis lagotis TaxID=92651 RepID=UPI003D68A767
MESHHWLPLETNPEFLKQLGLHPNWQFVDVYHMVLRPVYVVLLLFPLTEKNEVFRIEEEEKIKSEGQDITETVFFMKQTISNACGAIGLLYCTANNKDKMNFESGSILKMFLEESLIMSPEERARYLEKYEVFQVTHELSAHEGKIEALNIDEKVGLNFIALVHIDGHLYEVDRYKPLPSNHGETNVDTLLEDAIAVCKQFMERDPDELRFNAIFSFCSITYA